MSKKILSILLTTLMAFCLVGCGDNEQQTELLDYVNGDAFKEIVKVETEMVESYSSVSGDNYTSDDTMYKEIKDKTTVLAKELNDKALKISEDLKDEKLIKVHKIYIDYTANFLSALNMMEAALDSQDMTKVSDANEKLNNANQKAIDYKTELKKLAKEYDVEIKEK